nr:hypothetical protein [Mycolicibacterium komanii]CRL77920.1 hypothetical protein CPGR_04961 [Mycolicibacterium komanii]
MGSLGPPAWISLLIAVAIMGALCGFVTSSAMRRNRRHTRRIFVIGAFCGFLAGATHARRHVAAAALRAGLKHAKTRRRQLIRL